MIDRAYLRLTERAKELKCIYNVEEVLKDENQSLDEIFRKLLDIIPPAWQHATVCEARIVYNGISYHREDFRETEWSQSADIIIDNNILGAIEVFYTQFIRLVNNSQFLPEEQKLLNNITNDVSNFIFRRRLKQSLDYLQSSDMKSFDEQQLEFLPDASDEHWKWRLKMAQKIAYQMDFRRFGVVNVYLIGSVKTATAGPASDIDLLVHFRGDERQKEILTSWLGGWGLGLSEINYAKTGYETEGLIDLHIITDIDIKKKTSYAVMLNSSENTARLIR